MEEIIEVNLDVKLKTLDRLKKIDSRSKSFTTRFLRESGINLSKESSRICSETLMTNILIAVRKGYDGLLFNRDKDSYTKEVIVNGQGFKNQMTYFTAMSVSDWMEEQGYVIADRGYRYSKKHYKIGSLLFTEKLRNAIIEIEDLLGKVEPVSSVVILKDEDGKLKKFKRTEEIKAMVNFIQNYNNYLTNFKVVHGGNIIETKLCRMFSNSFKEHGRIYSIGGNQSYQTMKSVKRKSITIDDAEVVEVDFKNMHAAILYEMVGQKIGNRDIYDLSDYERAAEIFPLTKVTNPDVAKANLRKLAKSIFVRMLNTKSKKTCIQAVEFMIKQDMMKEDLYQDYPNIYIGVEDIKSLIELFVEKNQPIAHLLFQNSGLTLMNTDSQIMERVLQKCVEENLVALPLHDSVIVKRNDAFTITEFMKESYGEVLGTMLNCKLELK